MNNIHGLIDKFVILIIALTLYISSINHAYIIIPVLIAVILSALLSYFENIHIILGIFVAYIVLCFYEPSFLFFIPLICYDVILIKIKWVWTFALFPPIFDLIGNFTIYNVLIGAFLMVTYTLKYRAISLQNIKTNYYELQYNAKEISMQLEKENKDLIEKQDYEINLATLNERNRIARDIHDNVGHMLSRSILQIGALLTICKDDNIKENLNLIKDTLSEAMDSIRKSIHNLHDQSIDLQTEIQKLIDNFNFCYVKFDYDVNINPHKSIKYCFISVIKEALSNVIKHSNATKVNIAIREHPAIYQLVIQDNGTKTSAGSSNKSKKDIGYQHEKGIGLKNIEKRAIALNGNVNIGFNKGFRIFISVPKI